MDKVLGEYGIAGVCILLTLQVLIKVGEFLWKLREKKDSMSEDSIERLTKALEETAFSVRHLDQRIADLEESLAELPKFKQDLRRSFMALKSIAGGKWPSIRKDIMEEEP